MADQRSPMTVVRDFLSQRGYANHGLIFFDFAVACAAADAIDDTQLAIREFLDRNAGPDYSLAYLEVYGALQAGYVQQDALKALAAAVGFAINEFPTGMKRLRDIRNRTIGHPAEFAQGRRKQSPATFISRYGLKSGNLDVRQIHPDKTPEIYESIRVDDILNKHLQDCDNLFEQIATYVRNIKTDRRAEIRDKGPFSDLLHSSWDYLLRKIYELATEDPPSVGPAVAFVESIRAELKGIRAKLDEAGCNRVDRSHWERAEKAAIRLTASIEKQSEGADFEIEIDGIIAILREQIEIVRDALAQIDADTCMAAPNC